MKRFHYPASDDEFDDACDLDTLLHPAQAFQHPSEVVNDHDLTLNEKRAILASWASARVHGVDPLISVDPLEAFFVARSISTVSSAFAHSFPVPAQH
jgi:hypothetical protein